MLTLDIKLLVIAAGSIDGWPTVAGRIVESMQRHPEVRCVIVGAEPPRYRGMPRAGGAHDDDVAHLNRVSDGWAWRGAAAPTDGTEFATAWDALRALQVRHGIERHETLVLGATAVDMELAELAVVYVHVGLEDELTRKHRYLIPLWGQWATGVANVVSYFNERAWRDVVIQHVDMVEFVRGARRFYERPDAPAVVRQWHKLFCEEVIERFGAGIAGIFGTGFPFYCSTSNPTTPQSIIAYLSEQERYFGSKLVDEGFFESEATCQLSSESASKGFGLEFGTNRFDDYEYTSRGRDPIRRGTGARSLSEWHDAAAFAVASDPWPCHYCVSWQAPDLMPDQRVRKDTNVVCLRCRQTPFMLRNIMGCCVDLDVIVVVEDSSGVDAEAIKRYVVHESKSYLYDLDLSRTVLKEGDGPVDLFVATRTDVVAALSQLAEPGWLSVGFSSTALWSLPLPGHFFNLGEDFAVTWVEHSRLEPTLERELQTARAAFARAHDPDSVISALREHSLGHQQLLGNPGVERTVRDRLKSWTATPSTNQVKR